MGMVTVILEGSFGPARRHSFSAMKGGHAHAVSEAIKYLVEEEMPKAIINDHKCHKDGIEPSDGFGTQGKIL